MLRTRTVPMAHGESLSGRGHSGRTEPAAAAGDSGPTAALAAGAPASGEAPVPAAGAGNSAVYTPATSD